MKLLLKVGTLNENCGQGVIRANLTISPTKSQAAASRYELFSIQQDKEKEIVSDGVEWSGVEDADLR